MTTGRTRFLLEILFLIAVAGASAAFHWGPGAVAAAMGGAFVLVVAVEISTLRTERMQRPAQPRVQAPSAPAPLPPREETWVEALERLGRRAAPEPSRTTQAEAPTRRLTLPTRREEPPAPPARPAPRPAPTPELGPRAPQLRPPRRSEPEPAQTPPVSQPPSRVTVPETPPREPAQPPSMPVQPRLPAEPAAPEPSLEPARVAAQMPVSAPPAAEPAPSTVAPPAPEPEPTLVNPPPAAAPEPVRPAPAASSPVQWNLFELQSRARKIAGRDPSRDEECGFLFLYLREFASTDGLLSADFDSFIRESFPELLTGAA